MTNKELPKSLVIEIYYKGERIHTTTETGERKIAEVLKNSRNLSLGTQQYFARKARCGAGIDRYLDPNLIEIKIKS